MNFQPVLPGYVKIGVMVIIVLIVLGLCLGSFVNALVWRLHEQSKPKKQQKASAKDLSILTGRSMCPHCKHTLAGRDLIPVFSWVSLGGKCRYCHKKIEDSPTIELIMALLFIFSYIYWPLGFGSFNNGQGLVLFIFWLLFLTGFLAMFIYDLRWYLLPNRLVYPVFGLAIIQTLLSAVLFHYGPNTIREGLFGLLIGGGIFYLIFQVSKGKWIGGGDVKLGAVLGLIVGGPGVALLMLFIASCLGSLFSIPLLVLGKAKRNTRIPFGPFLIMAAIIVYLFGAGIIAWYKRQILS